MDKPPKVTVVLTSYNHAKFLHESIDSVLNQTYSDFRLLIWDDASTDESWAIINSYSDPRIQAFRNKTNQGGKFPEMSPEMVSGEYIAIHHSDDVWEPQKLEKQVPFLDSHPEIGAVFTNAMIIGEQGEPFEDKAHFYYSIFNQPNRSRHEWLNYFFNNGNALCHPSVLIRKICYENCGLYRYGLAQLPDFDMWVRLCLKYEIHVLPEKLVRFRIQANEVNASGNRPEARIRFQFELLQILNNFCSIKTSEEFIQVFPDANEYFKQEGFDIGFALGMVALKPITSPITKLFGLQLLFEALNDPDRAGKINALYDFGLVDFFELTGKHDVFSAEKEQALQALTAQVAEKEQTVQAFSAQVADNEQSVKALTAQVAEKEQAVQALMAQVAEQEQTVQGLTAQVAEKEQSVQALTAQVAEQEQSVQVLSTQVAEKEQSVQGLTAQVAEKEQALHVLSAQVAEFKQNLAEIKSGKAWKMALLFRRIRVLLAPPNSHRARVLRRLMNVFFVPFKQIRRNRRLKEDLALIRSSGLFDKTWYLTHNPDVTQAKVDPLLHYLRYGGFEGRDPGPNFSSAWYLEAYEDVKKAGINPLVHYLKQGREEGRKARPDQALIAQVDLRVL
jgi:glycosyltransferase involved in cell wall biosynthesis/uncharacterized coiled-coil protein SlyX